MSCVWLKSKNAEIKLKSLHSVFYIYMFFSFSLTSFANGLIIFKAAIIFCKLRQISEHLGLYFLLHVSPSWFSIGVKIVYLYWKRFLKYWSVLCKYNMNQNTCLKNMCNIYLFWKVSLEMIRNSIRYFQTTLTTSVPRNIYTTVWKIQSTDWVNRRQSGWKTCLFLLFDWSFAKVLVWYLHAFK